MKTKKTQQRLKMCVARPDQAGYSLRTYEGYEGKSSGSEAAPAKKELSA